jgi:phosphonate transport system substrate-binding protein
MRSIGDSSSVERRVMKINELHRRLVCGLLMTVMASLAHAQSPAKYSFWVVPQFSATELVKDWTPLLQRLSKDTGLDLELKLAPSIPRFEQEFIKGTADFAYMNPYHAVMAKAAQGYVPLVRDAKPLSGILLTRNDGPYKSLKDLQGKPVGFPAPNAFGASLYMRALLAEQEGILIEPVYLKTHSNVFRNILRNEVVAGGSINTAFNEELPEVKDHLRVIFKTPEQAPHPISAHPRVPDTVKKKLAQALLNLANDEVGRGLLNNIRITKPVLASYENDYASLDKLNLKKYLVVEPD